MRVQIEVLVRRRPNAVSKSDLFDALWPSTFVSHGNLTVLMTEIRKAIGDVGREHGLIGTIHGLGYALSADAAEQPLPPRRTTRTEAHRIEGR